MNAISIYLSLGIIAGLAIAINLIFFYNRHEKGLSWLAGLSFTLIIAGIFLGGQRIMGYSLLGVGVMLTLIDIIQHEKSKVNL